jgi:hypothetical protein
MRLNCPARLLSLWPWPSKDLGSSALEKAGLVRVRRKPRRNPIVTIVDWRDRPPAVDDDWDVTDARRSD